MTVRITESRLPAGSQPSDFGEVAEQTLPGGERYVLVSFMTSPLRTGCLHDYVVLALGGADADEYRWTFEDPGGTVSFTTQNGWASQLFDAPGAFDVSVEVVLAGDVVATLVLEQTVVAPDPLLEQRLQATHPSLDEVSADGLREVRNDFSAYVTLASDATGSNGVPTRLVSTILVFEGSKRPKHGTKVAERMVIAGSGQLVRETEIETQADLYQWGRPKSVPGLDGQTSVESNPPFPGSFGPGQLSQLRAASQIGMIPWREITPGTFLNLAAKVARYRDGRTFWALPYEDQVDVFNLVRFPKSNIALVAKLLADLKNRTHRWPDTAKADVLTDGHLFEIVASEYWIGPTTTPRAAAKPNQYGDTILALASPGSILFDDVFP